MCEDPEQPVYISCPPPSAEGWGEGCRLKTHTGGCQIGKKQIDRIEGIVEWKTREARVETGLFSQSDTPGLQAVVLFIALIMATKKPFI
ncbi:hypothetical protein CEXT_735201 [Caerostris extrusa]|uniref:Uncharacterized protein n=1 Tax=Caerostris extrusa TaxID=172846 RepID=A0AAV4UV17_CAEEX|nr:hypothetical protein CEXT_735201 [Caerostris extrusa]